jgi:branched-chain amino acid transport system substrate-binding protein
MKPVAIEKFNIDDKDMSAQLRRARAAGAQVLLTYGIGPELAQIANARAKLNWSVPMVGSWPLAMSNFIDNAGPNGEGARMPQTFIEEGPHPRHRGFMESYRRFTGQNRIPSPTAAAQGYDSLYVLAAAIRQAESTAGPAIHKALENLQEKIEGVVQTYDKPFSRHDHEAIDTLSIPVMGEVRQGRVIYAYEDQRRQALKR